MTKNQNSKNSPRRTPPTIKIDYPFFFNYARAGKFYLLSIRGTKVQTLPYKIRKINLNPIGQVNIL